jgi:hypothetical protein
MNLYSTFIFYKKIYDIKNTIKLNSYCEFEILYIKEIYYIKMDHNNSILINHLLQRSSFIPSKFNVKNTNKVRMYIVCKSQITNVKVIDRNLLHKCSFSFPMFIFNL